MRSECVKKMVSESRKIRKPLMEKKRRARINDSLETLKQILLDSKTTLKESISPSSPKKSGEGTRTAKLEKADILEMTVKYVQYLHTKLNQIKNFENDDIHKKQISCVQGANMSSSVENMKIGVTLIPTKLKSGEIVFVVPSNLGVVQQARKITENVWRPW